MKLYEYLRPELIILDLEEGTVEEILRRLLEPLIERDLIGDREDTLAALLRRERRQSTAIGHGVAIPHAGCRELDEPLIALALAPGGVDFNAPDEEPIRIFFLLLSPPGQSSTHIKLLARIARLMRIPDTRKLVLEAADGREVIERIRRMDEQHP